MALSQHPRLLLLLLLACVAQSSALRRTDARSLPISDLKSKLSGVEELLEEFRQQLTQDPTRRAGDALDSCAGDFDAVGERIIRTKASIERGATFLLVPDRVYTWKDCVRACCSQPHCTVAVVQQDRRQLGDTLSCYLFNCTYRGASVCSFAPQQGFTTYSRSPNATAQGPLLPGSPGGAARGPGEEKAQGGGIKTTTTTTTTTTAGGRRGVSVCVVGSDGDVHAASWGSSLWLKSCTALCYNVVH